MGIVRYLAMTEGQIPESTGTDHKIGWMACRFSPYSTGLCNLPRSLPPGSMLILDDANPISGHDPGRVEAELVQCMESLACGILLLDFQRPHREETQALAERLCGSFPRNILVSSVYARDLNCPVLLPPVMPDVAPEDHLRPWQHREVWLELSYSPIAYRITREGAFPEAPSGPVPMEDNRLFCHYGIRLEEEAAVFTMVRTPADLYRLEQAASEMGVQGFVGLWQELETFLSGK